MANVMTDLPSYTASPPLDQYQKYIFTTKFTVQILKIPVTKNSFVATGSANLPGYLIL